MNEEFKVEKAKQPVHRIELEQRTLDEKVIDLMSFVSAVNRLVELRGAKEGDITCRMIARLTHRYGVWNLRGETRNMRFTDLGPA